MNKFVFYTYFGLHSKYNEGQLLVLNDSESSKVVLKVSLSFKGLLKKKEEKGKK